jgi:hypothetical protein
MAFGPLSAAEVAAFASATHEPSEYSILNLRGVETVCFRIRKPLNISYLLDEDEDIMESDLGYTYVQAMLGPVIASSAIISTYLSEIDPVYEEIEGVTKKQLRKFQTHLDRLDFTLTPQDVFVAQRDKYRSMFCRLAVYRHIGGEWRQVCMDDDFMYVDDDFMYVDEEETAEVEEYIGEDDSDDSDDDDDDEEDEDEDEDSEDDENKDAKILRKRIQWAISKLSMRWVWIQAVLRAAVGEHLDGDSNDGFTRPPVHKFRRY